MAEKRQESPVQGGGGIGSALSGGRGGGCAGSGQMNSRYGSREWLDGQFRKANGDPWGHDWRASQFMRYEMHLELLEKFAGRKAVNLRVLDIGCALGDFTAMLVARFPQCNVEGLDISQEALDRAKLRFRGLHFVCVDFFTHPTVVSKADIICCLEVLYYLERSQRDAAVHTISDRLLPGGICLFSARIGSKHFNFDELPQLVGRHMDILEVRYIHLRWYQYLEKPILRLISLLDRSVASRHLSRMLRQLFARQNIVQLFHTLGAKINPERTASHSFLLARRR